MRNPQFQLVLNLLKIVAPIAIIGFLLFQIETEQWNELAEHPKDYPSLVGALLVAVLAISLSFVRWCLLVRCQGIELSMLEAHRLGAIGFLLNFVSAGSVGGDLFKAIFLAKRRPGKRVEAVASVLVDRAVGLYGLVLLATGALLYHDQSDAIAIAGQDLRHIQFWTTCLAAIGSAALAVLVFGGKFVDKLVRQGGRLPLIGSIILKVGSPLRVFHHHSLTFGISIVMSIVVHSMLTISMYLIARSLYPAVPTLAEHMIIVPIAMLASAAPITPAGVGVLELVMKWLYEVIPATATRASGTLVALVFELVKIVVAAIGTAFYWTAEDAVRKSLEEAENDTIDDEIASFPDEPSS